MTNPTAPPVEAALPELLPCPFCGGKAFTYPCACDRRSPYREHDRAYPIARCNDCYAEVCGQDWTGVETVIAAWNRRAYDREAFAAAAQSVGGEVVAWRCREKNGSGMWRYIEYDTRSPDSYELRECEIENVYLAPPASVPVEKLRELTAKWRREAAAFEPVCGVDTYYQKAARVCLRRQADEIESLIQQESGNGE